MLLCVQGCSAPLVVKIADTDKEKAQRRLHQAMASLGNQFGGMNNLTAFGLGIGTAAYYQQVPVSAHVFSCVLWKITVWCLYF